MKAGVVCLLEVLCLVLQFQVHQNLSESFQAHTPTVLEEVVDYDICWLLHVPAASAKLSPTTSMCLYFGIIGHLIFNLSEIRMVACESNAGEQYLVLCHLLISDIKFLRQ